jgi:hypothetical protein
MLARRLLVPVLLAAALALGASLSACEDDTPSTPCTDDQSCAFGSVCVKSQCTVIPCEGPGDCSSIDHICAQTTAGKVCSAPECGCATCGSCGAGQVCSQGQCKTDPGGPGPCTDAFCPGKNCIVDSECAVGTEKCVQGNCWSVSACFAPSDCAADQVCDGHACRPCAGAECPAVEDCTTAGCPSGQECADDGAGAKVCKDIVGVAGDQCSTCSSAGDCPAGWSCDPLSSGKACLMPCASNNECQTGWSCQASKCIPDGYRCDKCVTAGCPEGEVCDTITQECKAPRASCEPCTYGWECGPEAACVRLDTGARVCKPRCSAATDCPGGKVCEVDPDSKVQVCASVGGACCYKENAAECGPVDACDPPCGSASATPFCVNKSCVQCTNDTHCSGGAKCNAAGTCQGGGGTECVDPTPYLWEGACVECLNNTHCPVGFCKSSTHTCEEDTGVCSTCGDAYPACAEVGGELYCVPCTDDSYCNEGCKCDTASFTCEGNCVSDTFEKCKSDADCDPGITGYILTCETSTGLCVDANGGCDDITAFCKGGGKCSNFLEAFGLGGGGLPFPLPGGTGGGAATLPGGCACDFLIELVSPPEKKVCGTGLCFGFGGLIPGVSNVCIGQ